MDRYKTLAIFQFLITFCLCEINVEEKAKLVNGFVRFYNSLPNQPYTCDEGYLLSAQNTDITNAYNIEVSLKVSEVHNVEAVKYLKCSAMVADVDIGPVVYEHPRFISVLSHECHEDLSNASPTNVEAVERPVNEPAFSRRPVQLDNEVQTNTAVTSGEQFIAVPREEQKKHCIGCSSHVNPEAEGVSELAAIGVRQLNSLEPSVQHTLKTVVDVERQVQVVNGIRYILTLIVDYNSCITPESTQPCITSNACKIAILEKPWMQLTDGSKFRAILSNNCTEQWRFGDDGVVVPTNPTDNKDNNNINPSNDNNPEDIIKPVQSVVVQSQQQTEKTLTDEDIKNIQEQIISNDKLNTETTATATFQATDEGKDHVEKIETETQYSPNAIQPTKPHKVEGLEEDKKKTIDDLINFFNFDELDHAEVARTKRSFNSDLGVLNIAEKYRKLKKSITNSKHIYFLAQTVVEYMNKVDLEIKNRILKDVINAEMESENKNHFFYIQFRTIIPCDDSACKKGNKPIKVCNAIIDSSEKEPQILNVFCNDEEKHNVYLGKVNRLSENDPVLLNLIGESIKKIEKDSQSDKAFRLSKIIEATTRKAKGFLTKISLVLDEIDCNKTVPLKLRSNCSAEEKAGSTVCDITIFERDSIKEKDITYSCIDRSTDISFSKKSITTSVNDPKVRDILQEALNYLDDQSNRNNKQILVSVVSVSTQLVAGFLTRIEFVVGYTTCLSSVKLDENQNSCKLLQNVPLRKCIVKHWDRAWIQEDENKFEVLCDDSDVILKRKKRSVHNEDQVLGGETEQDTNDPKYQVLAEESMQKYLQESGNSRPHKLVRIEKVTYQTVAGSLTKIYFKISPLESSSGDVISCESKIWEQTWAKKKDIDVKCKIDDTTDRNKRSVEVTGGVSDRDPNDPKYKALAEESMQKYLQESGISRPHKLVRIEKVTYQTVAGSLTKIYFKISPLESSSGDVISCESKIWEQTWAKKKDIDVKCKIDDTTDRNKRSVEVTGGVSDRDPNDPKYKALAEESMQKYLQESGISRPHKLVRIEKVTYQTVAGSLTKIYFKISPLESSSGDVISCESKIWEQTWAKKKDIDVKCKIDDTTDRNKRSVEVTGGVSDRDPNDPKYKALAEESMQKYLQESGNFRPHKLVRIEKVTYQTVAGSLTKIYFKICPLESSSGDVISCKSEIWEQPWMKKKEIDVQCKIDDTTHRNKRSPTVGLPGGESEGDPNDPKYKALAEESMQKYLQESGISRPHKLVRIEKVTYQTVAGSLTKIYFKICPLESSSGDVISCKSEIWEQPWMKKKEIDVQCKIDDTTHRNKRSPTVGLPGGESEGDPNDPKYKALAEESMQKYLQESGISRPHKLVRIEKVTYQTVAGSLTKIYFKISPLESSSGDVISCHSNIWERAWIDKKEIDVNCEVKDIKNRMKRNIITGGLSKQDPNSPKYRILAEKSLSKYLSDIGNEESHEIVKIKKVTTQVVSGIKTIIEFNVASKALPFSLIRCISYIWEQPWRNKTEINVDCKSVNSLQRNKREIRKYISNNKKMVGAIQEEDATKAEFKDLAEESLTKYKKHLTKVKFHVVAEVKKVTTQVVSGFRYTIDFVAAPASCAQDVSTCDDMSKVLNCHSVLKDQPWLNHKEIDVSCNSPYKRKRRHNLDDTRDNIVLSELTENDKFDEDRPKRQADDDDIEDDTKLYYADRAVEHLNTQSDSKNLYKLIALHAVQSSTQMENTPVVRMYIEVAETFCLRHYDENHLAECEEMDAMNHKLCLARVWPSADDEMIVKQVSIVCDDDEKFESVSGISLANMIKVSLEALEKPRSILYKLVHLGEPHLIPSLDSKVPFKLKFIIGTTNCSKNVESYKKGNCFLETTKPSKACTSYIWLAPNSKAIDRVTAKCGSTESRQRRSIPVDPTNATVDDLLIQKLVQESLDKLEMSTPQRYKQKVLNINSFSTKVTSGKVTTIDFDVGFTSCLKYAWVDDVSSCELLEHLPRRRCVSQIWERLWLENGRDIEVTCKDEDEPLEAHVEFESAVLAKALAHRALKHIEAKYPHPRKQKVVRIFSLDKQVVAGVHYRMKVEVATTNCSALSNQNISHCKPQQMGGSENKFCTVNVWLRPWTDHPPNYRVTCDYQEGAMADMYHQVQAEHLFREFIATHMPDYMNDHDEIVKRFEIFRANILKMHELNTHERGTASYGVTRFADLTYEEFTTKHMGLKHSLRDVNQVPMGKAVIPNVDIPNKFDWREQGAVTEVKNQGSCGSCWAFSVTGNIEGQWKLKSGKLVSLSEQELVDCDTMDDGCNGGLPDNAYRAIEQIGGLEMENDYPYEGENDKCSFNKTLSRVQISGAVNISSNETDMAKWLVAHGPISIGINANAMQFYMGGVSHPWKMLCNPNNLDHGVLIVGYGVKNYPLFHKRLPYWIVKNSWGTSWGEQGYYRVYRGDGTCGVNQMASSAVI